MDVLDKFFKKYSYKFPKGYPDMNNKQDVLLLESILGELGINSLKEAGESESYNNLITKKLGNLPIPKENYTLGKPVNVNGDDAVIFKQLYSLAPPKKGSTDDIGSKGSGHGEVALYWLLSKNYNVQDNRKGGAADLLVSGEGVTNVGVEVKAYDSKAMTLGRFGSDTENIKLLNTIFGLYSLITTLEDKSSDKNKLSALNFNATTLSAAFKKVADFSKEEDLRKLNYPLIKNIFANIDSVLKTLDVTPQNFQPEQATANLLKKLLKTKLEIKPGFGGYIANVDINGKIEYHLVTEDKINNLEPETINKYVSANGGALVIFPNELFPSSE
jgi:hypothetical protein